MHNIISVVVEDNKASRAPPRVPRLTIITLAVTHYSQHVSVVCCLPTCRISVRECALDLLTLKCSCDFNCFDKLRNLNLAAETMASARLEYLEAGHRNSSKLLFKRLKRMRFTKVAADSTRSFILHYHVKGTPVCRETWFVYHDLTSQDSRVKRILAMLKRGEQHYVAKATGAKKSGRPDQRGMTATAWIESYIQDYADQMPTDCLFRLDPVDVKEVHDAYTQYMKTYTTAGSPISYSWFHARWRQVFQRGIKVNGVPHKVEIRPGLF